MDMEQNQDYPLCFENHKRMFTKSLTDFLIKKAFVDVTLVCQGEEMMAHQIMLAACSPLFERLLIEKSQSHPKFIFVDISKYEMLIILEFIYKGTVNVSKILLPALLKIAKMLEIRDLEYAISRRNGPKLDEQKNLPVTHRILGTSSTRNRLNYDQVLSMNERVPSHSTPLSTSVIIESRSDSKLKVINPFAKRRQYLEDSDSTFCEDDLAKAGPSKLLSPPSTHYDSDIEIVDNNPVCVISESQSIVNNSPEWYRKTQMRNKKRVKEEDPQTTTVTYSSDDSEISSSLPKKVKKNTIHYSDDAVEETDIDNLDKTEKIKQSALDKQTEIHLLSFSKLGNYCVVCGKFKRNIQKHIKKTHCVPPRGKKFTCKICSKVFYFEFSIKLHKCTPTSIE